MLDSYSSPAVLLMFVYSGRECGHVNRRAILTIFDEKFLYVQIRIH